MSDPATVNSCKGSDNHDGNYQKHQEQDDVHTERIIREAKQALKDEPELCSLLKHTVLASWVQSFEDAVTATVCYRMLLKEATTTEEVFCPHALKKIFQKAFSDESVQTMGHSLKDAVRKDAQAVMDRDPACETLLEVVLFYKGFSALVVHRVAHTKWIASKRRSMTALFLQSQASAVFGLDIHPGAQIGAGILLDHGTGIVIGETACIGDGCTLLHGVTLGGTGKDTGDRHPKVGKNVLIGAGASVLGNIQIGDRVKIGAGSIVLRPLPVGSTAVGAPAKIIGKTLESNPADAMDEGLQQVGHFHHSPSTITLSTSPTSIREKSTASTISTASSSSSSSSSGSSAENVEETSESSEEDGSSVCPYREYAKFATRIAKKIPVGSDGVTLDQYSRNFEHCSCPKGEIVASFFTLDQRNVGYLKKSDLTPDFVTKALAESTTLNSEQIGKFLQKVK